MKTHEHDFMFREFVVNTNKNFSPAEIFAMYNDPYAPKTVRQIRDITGRSISEIYRAIEDYGGPTRQGRNYHLIFGYAAQGMKPREIAELTGYSARGITNILNRSINGNQPE